MEAGQIIVLVLLILIGIILFVVFIVELTNVPAPIIVPFADGTIIKIKSLSNNLYLKPVPCNLIGTCDNNYIRAYCDANPTRTIISAVGQFDDPLTNWQLCQYSSITDEGEAKYLIFSESNQNPVIMKFDAQRLVLESTNGICTQMKSENIDVCNVDGTNSYFSFILNEKDSSLTSTTSGSYNILSVCATSGPPNPPPYPVIENGYVFSDGQGATSLPANICPPLVLSQTNAGSDIGCENGVTDDPRCILNYLFEIEVQ